MARERVNPLRKRGRRSTSEPWVRQGKRAAAPLDRVVRALGRRSRPSDQHDVGGRRLLLYGALANAHGVAQEVDAVAFAARAAWLAADLRAAQSTAMGMPWDGVVHAGEALGAAGAGEGALVPKFQAAHGHAGDRARGISDFALPRRGIGIVLACVGVERVAIVHRHAEVERVLAVSVRECDLELANAAFSRPAGAPVPRAALLEAAADARRHFVVRAWERRDAQDASRAVSRRSAMVSAFSCTKGSHPALTVVEPAGKSGRQLSVGSQPSCVW